VAGRDAAPFRQLSRSQRLVNRNQAPGARAVAIPLLPAALGQAALLPTLR
jgi:hypothetical protein